MKIRVDNPILQWIGKHAFAVYILQRLPMIALSENSYNASPYLFVVMTISVVFVIAYLYTKLMNGFDNKVLLNK